MDTFGFTLTYTMYKLSQDITLQSALFDELRLGLPEESFKAFQQSSSGHLFEVAGRQRLSQQLEALPLLGAIIKEGLRLRNTVPTANPRVVPEGLGGEGVMLCGYQIPPRTTISCFAYSVHREAAIFEDPEAFRPSRWLRGDTAKAKEMGKWSWPLGSGNRVCIGQYLALEST